MAKTHDTSSFWNPVALLTDLGMRALDFTLSSSQSVSEGVDRFARAGASVEATEGEVSSSAVSRRAASVTSSGVAMAADLQRSAFDLLMRGWVQWMSAVGSFASMGAELVGPRSAGRIPVLESLRKGFLPVEGSETGSQRAGMSRQQSRTREAHAERGPMEHAIASAEPKRRRSTATGRSRSAAKPRRSRST